MRVDANTPIGCLTFGQFIEAFREATEKPEKKELPKYISVSQLSELTGYSVSTIHIKNSKREIPGSKKLGGRVIFETKDVLEWIESGAVKTKRDRIKEMNDSLKKK